MEAPKGRRVESRWSARPRSGRQRPAGTRLCPRLWYGHQDLSPCPPFPASSFEVRLHGRICKSNGGIPALQEECRYLKSRATHAQLTPGQAASVQNFAFRKCKQHSSIAEIHQFKYLKKHRVRV